MGDLSLTIPGIYLYGSELEAIYLQRIGWGNRIACGRIDMDKVMIL